MAIYEELAGSVRAETPVALATVLRGPAVGGPEVGAKLLVRTGAAAVGSLGDVYLDRVVARDSEGELAAGTSRVRHYGPQGQARRDDVAVFIESFVAPPQMIIFGAVDFTAALARIAKVLGYGVTVCDARAAFATPARFPCADSIVVDWPDSFLERVGPTLTPRDAICVLTHDAKFDVPAIVGALTTAAGYVGAMGSRRTDRDRVRRLREAGVDDAGIARVHAPIGLAIGARTPEETAVSICAEIIAARAGRADGRPLGRVGGPIHHR